MNLKELIELGEKRLQEMNEEDSSSGVSIWVEKKGFGYEIDNPILSFWPLDHSEFIRTIAHKKYPLYSIRRVGVIKGKEHMIDKYVVTCLNTNPNENGKLFYRYVMYADMYAKDRWCTSDVAPEDFIRKDLKKLKVLY